MRVIIGIQNIFGSTSYTVSIQIIYVCISVINKMLWLNVTHFLGNLLIPKETFLNERILN